jgi:uncharacterized protein YbjT (DUF2867 family)
MKKAIVIGGTGMVGTQLIKLLIDNEEFSEILSLVRRSSGIIHPKLTEQIIDFDHPKIWKELIKGDVLFSTLGTTIAQAKTKENQYKIDFTYQFTVAEIASKNRVSTYVLISSAGADSKSKIFYSNMKGKLDDAISHLPFQVISILRPGQLTGDRTEKRMGEKIGLSVMTMLNKLGILKKYRPIHASQVAKAMINAASKTKSEIYTLQEVHELADIN